MIPVKPVTLLLLLFVGGLQELARAEDTVIQTKLLSEHGSTRATNYRTSNKIVTFAGKTHVSWLDSVSETMVASFDHATGSWTVPVKVGTGIDNHGGPALTCDSSGYLHIVFGPHGRQPFQHCRSARPNNSEKWIQLDDFGANPIYPSLVCDDKDTLHIVYNGGDSPFKLAYQQRPKDGDWSKPIFLVKTPGREYINYLHNLAITMDGILHLTFAPHYKANGLGHQRGAGHLMSHDRGKTWTLAKGSPVKLPIETSSEAMVWRAKVRAEIYGLACSSDGQPWVLVSLSDIKGIYTQELYHHDGEMWHRVKPIFLNPSQLQGEASPRFVMMTIDTNDRIYLTAIIKGHVVVACSTDRGMTFQVLPVFPPDTTLAHSQPNFERATGHHSVSAPWLLFSTGEKGRDLIDKGIFKKVRVLQLTSDHSFRYSFTE